MTAPDAKAIRDVRKYKLVHSNDYQSQMFVRPDGSWVKHDDYLALCDALDKLRAENERLQTIIGNLHAVEEKHRETANAQFHRANRLQVENERLRAALYAERRSREASEQIAYWSDPAAARERMADRT